MSPSAAPAVGQAAPDFTLKGPGGQRITLSEFKGSKNVLLVFYPLAFSPVCSNQLPQIQGDLSRLQALDIEVFGISVDSHWSNTRFAQDLGLTFPLLSDWNREASEAYGVLLPSPGYSNRALFLVDKQCRIAYQQIQEDIQEIPDIEKVIDALKART